MRRAQNTSLAPYFSLADFRRHAGMGASLRHEQPPMRDMPPRKPVRHTIDMMMVECQHNTILDGGKLLARTTAVRQDGAPPRLSYARAGCG